MTFDVPAGIAAQLAGQFGLRDREAVRTDYGVRMVFDSFRADKERCVLARGEQLLRGWQRLKVPPMEVGPGRAQSLKGSTVLTWPLS